MFPYNFMETTEYCERYAKKENIANAPMEDSSDEEEVSDCQSTASSDDVAGQVDP